MKKYLIPLLSLLILSPLPAAPVAFSGKVAINGLNYSGAAAFTFALRDQNGTIHWRNGANAFGCMSFRLDRDKGEGIPERIVYRREDVAGDWLKHRLYAHSKERNEAFERLKATSINRYSFWILNDRGM